MPLLKLPVQGLIPLVVLGLASILAADDLKISLQSQKKTGSSAFETTIESQRWKSSETAIIVCDFWDLHHCKNAVDRMKEFGPRLNQVLNKARSQGVTIIHSPSDCMPFYQSHPARQRALKVKDQSPPAGIQNWCSKIPSEESAAYPIDQSDGGEDDDPAEHAVWAAKLKAMGRNPGMPWKKQNDMLTIDSEQDYISDAGDEVWNVLKSNGIKNVILVGVHTNMCVLGRPFGLRQMKQNGFNVALMRDMTDTMYNPKRWPFVSHYAGTELVLHHIERFVCPTITSDQILGGNPFHFVSDPRPHLLIVIGEAEYRTRETLPKFAYQHLRDFRVDIVHANADDRNDLGDLSRYVDADLMLVSMRRRVLPKEQLQFFRDFEAAGKPILGIRTSSHAFCLRNQSPPDGLTDWPEFDAEVFGGNYTNHYGNSLKSKVSFTDEARQHPITHSIAIDQLSDLGDRRGMLKSFQQGGSLYKTSPLNPGANVLLSGTVLGHPPEPVAWTYKRMNGGRSFYTSLGHVADFQNADFQRLLKNALAWAAGIKLSASSDSGGMVWRKSAGISFDRMIRGRLKFRLRDQGNLADLEADAVFRCVARFSAAQFDSSIQLWVDDHSARLWINGTEIEGKADGDQMAFVVSKKQIRDGEANWINIGLTCQSTLETGRQRTVSIKRGEKREPLKTGWEWAPVLDKFETLVSEKLPAKFGGATDVFVDVK